MPPHVAVIETIIAASFTVMFIPRIVDKMCGRYARRSFIHVYLHYKKRATCKNCKLLFFRYFVKPFRRSSSFWDAVCGFFDFVFFSLCERSFEDLFAFSL